MKLNPWLRHLANHLGHRPPSRRRPRTAGQVPALIERLEDRTLLTIYTVDSTADTVDATDGVTTLREALQQANAHPNDAAADEIHFAIPTTDPGYDPAAGTFTIQPTTILIVTDDVVIDGYTQPGASPNTLADGDNAVLKVVLNGAKSTDGTGLNIGAGNMGAGTVRGLVVNGWQIGINAGSHVVIEGNFIGTDATGTVAAPNTGEGAIVTDFSATDTLIGGTTPAARNVISGNSRLGIEIHGPAANIRVQGNFIGTDASGTAALGNGNGILVAGFTDDPVIDRSVLIGGTEPGARNIVSGNDGWGIYGSKAAIQGNFVGTDVTGTKALGNGGTGILGAGLTGGTQPGAGNLVSANSAYQVYGFGTIQGNFIGTDVTGTKALGGFDSVFISTPDSGGPTLLGGTELGARNVITGVVRVTSGAGGDIIQGNYIGLDATGTVPLHPVVGSSAGVYLYPGTHDVLIGGSQPGAGNVIAGFEYQIHLDRVSNNRVQGNYLGTDARGQQIPETRQGIGVAVVGNGNIIGTDGDDVGDDREGNLIAFNTWGVSANKNEAGNTIRGNSIHSNTGLGINFDGGGRVTPNDQDETDGLQNFPVIATASGGATTHVTGTLNSKPGSTFTIDFYANREADPSGYGEGERWLGFTTVTTDADGNASFAITLAKPTVTGESLSATATAADGSTSEFSADVRITNAPPVATAGGPYSVGEGGSVTLDGTASSDPDQSANTLTYQWDFDGDGDYDDATGAQPTFSAATLDGPTTATVGLRVTDAGGLTSTATATINVLNAAPTAVLSGPAGGVRGQTLTYTVAVSDPSLADTQAGIAFVVDWGDGTSETVSRQSGQTQIALSHLYGETGSYTVSAVATDKDGASSAAASLGVGITVVSATPGGDLIVGGTVGDDHIVFSPGASSGDVQVTLNGQVLGTYQQPARLVAYGQDGDDDLQVAGGIAIDAWLYGDGGNDRLKGGAGHNVLLGGSGDDLLVGGGNRDLLIGGTGADRLVGSAEDDILIAGFTDYDYVRDSQGRETGLLQPGEMIALQTLLGAWLSTADGATAAARTQSLHDGVQDQNGATYALDNGRTVHSDGTEDVLTSSAGTDWFLLDSEDRATDLRDEVFAGDLDFLLG